MVRNGELMKKIILSIFAVMILLNLVSAIQLRQERRFINTTGGDTTLSDGFITEVHTSVSYYAQDYLTDFLRGGKPYVYFVDYNSQLETWNNKIPNSKIAYCNLSFYENKHLDNQTKILTSIYITKDFTDKKYFLELSKGDFNEIDLICRFYGNRTLETPVNYDIVTPTNLCQACQKIDWIKQDAETNRVNNLQTFQITNLGYIYKTINYAYKEILVLFWLFLILMIIGVFYLILFLFLKGYKIVRGLAKK